MSEYTQCCVVCTAYVRFRLTLSDTAREEKKPETEVKDVFGL